MSGLPVFVEPIPGGFRASATGPADLVAEGATADGAVAALQAKVDAKMLAGAMFTKLRVDDREFLEIIGRMASNPLSERFHQDLRDARAAADAADSDHPL